MAKTEVEELTQKTIDSGGILAKLYFDMQSETADDLQPLMADLINNRLLKSQGVVYCFGAIDEPIRLDKTYSTNAAITALFKDLISLINVAFNFAPAGIEILKPQRDYVLKPSDLQSLVLNIASVSVEYSNYILERVMKKEDYEKIMESVKSREALGKKLLEGKKPPDKK